MTTKYNIPATIWAEFDETEPDVRVSFFFSPGSYTTSRDPANFDPAVIEDIVIIYPDGKKVVPEGELLAKMEDFCWQHIRETSRPDNDE